MRYPPHGIRGMALMARATVFGQNFEEYYKNYNDNAFGVIQIETLESLNHLDDIANIDGVDVLFVGPADMTLAMGIFRQFDHPDYLDVLKKVDQAAKKAGKATGTIISKTGEYEKYYNLGYRFLACGSDSVFVNEGALNMVKALKEMKP